MVGLGAPVTHWDRRGPRGPVCGRAVGQTRTTVPRRRAAGTAAVPGDTPGADFSEARKVWADLGAHGARYVSRRP